MSTCSNFWFSSFAVLFVLCSTGCLGASSPPLPSSTSLSSLAGGNITRIGVLPPQCSNLQSCYYMCSATYAVSLDGTQLVPGTVPSCTCGTGTITGLTVSFSGGFPATSRMSGCTVWVQRVDTTSGLVCTGTYAITNTAACSSPPPATNSAGAFVRPAAVIVVIAAISAMFVVL